MRVSFVPKTCSDVSVLLYSSANLLLAPAICHSHGGGGLSLTPVVTMVSKAASVSCSLTHWPPSFSYSASPNQRHCFWKTYSTFLATWTVALVTVVLGLLFQYPFSTTRSLDNDHRHRHEDRGPREEDGDVRRGKGQTDVTNEDTDERLHQNQKRLCSGRPYERGTYKSRLRM